MQRCLSALNRPRYYRRKREKGGKGCANISDLAPPCPDSKPGDYEFAVPFDGRYWQCSWE